MLLRFILGGIFIVILGVALASFTWVRVDYVDFLFWKVPVPVAYQPFAILEIPFIVIGIAVLAYGLIKTEE